MLDYDREAAVYDTTRGGVPRAAAAAAAVLGLLPDRTRTLLDIGCGTGLVTERLHRPGLRVLGCDGSYGMARMAADRLGGGVVLGDVRRLPLRDASVDAVSAVWLLHLVRRSAAVVAEVARVLGPGGVFVTTVDKDAGHDVGSDIDAVLRPHRSFAAAFDRADFIEEYAAAGGLRPVGRARFTGHGQGRTPRSAADVLSAGRFASWFTDGDGGGARRLAVELRRLPDQDRRRPDPAYTLVAFRKET
ncbi:class I SAM-dependent methyltransferase [Streptomyces xantholiticus]|uniref:class I SAM-dependent methyltransferase n=1 Tax=Streptomyces xantholiticus TaxID=68285 RepID=UPI00167722EF|nr:class I SAM-dependent methyltransferase [Streptomyces xantholiticus]GGW24710.1 methyltransferase [Streptomyces xantholiticus]